MGRIPFIFLMDSYCELAKSFSGEYHSLPETAVAAGEMTAAVDHLMNEKKERDREVLLVKNQSEWNSSRVRRFGVLAAADIRSLFMDRRISGSVTENWMR